MASNPPPSEGSESSFWASVYQPGSPTILSGVLTDLNLHRFTLHQHLSTHLSKRLCLKQCNNTSASTQPASNRLTFMSAEHLQHLTPSAGIPRGSISRTPTLHSTMILRRKCSCLQLTISCRAAPFNYHELPGTPSAPPHRLLLHSNTAQLRPLPLSPPIHSNRHPHSAHARRATNHPTARTLVYRHPNRLSYVPRHGSDRAPLYCPLPGFCHPHSTPHHGHSHHYHRLYPDHHRSATPS